MIGETILVPLDGSTQSEAVLPYAAAIAKAQGIRLRLLTVIEIGQLHPLLVHLEHASVLRERLQGEVGHFLSNIATTLTSQGIGVSSAVVTGIPTEEILRAAEAGDVAMIAMATHGRGGLQRWALGSVADKVMRTGLVPTLLVRPPEDPQEARKVELHQILVPLDGSPLAEAAIEPAANLAKAAGAKLVLLRIEPWLSAQAAFATEAMYIPDLSQLEDEAEAAAKEYLDTACRHVSAGIPCESIVQRGFANIMLEAYIEQNPIDLVVMSTHGRGGITRFVIGSKADALVRAGVPTLLIRPDALLQKLSDIEPSVAVAP